MDNNNGNTSGNQPPDYQESPKPIFETVEDTGMQAEEVPSNVANTEEALFSVPLDVPPDQSFYGNNGGGSSRAKMFIIGGAVLFFIIILVIILRIFMGGGGGGGGDPEKVTLNYWTLWEEKDMYEEVVKAYREKNKHVTITFTTLPKKEYLEKMLARAPNGVGPDIFRFHNTWLPLLKDLVAPLPSTVMANADFEKTFYPVHSRDLKVGEYYYGIPLEIDGLVLVYNNTLFKNAGITSPPSSPDDLTRIAGRLTIKDPQTGGIQIGGLALGSAKNVEHFSDIYGLWLLQNYALTDKDFAKKSRNEIWSYLLKINTKEGASIFETYRFFAEDNGTWSDIMPNSVSAFIEQKAAMVIVPSWQVLLIKEQNPDLDIKVVPVPQFKERNNTPVALASYWVEGVSKHSKNQLEAWKFLKYLSEKDNMVKLYEKQKKFRLFGEPYSRVDLADKLASDPYVGAVIKQAPYYYSLPLSSRTYDGVSGNNNIGGLNDAIIKYLEDTFNKRADHPASSPSEALTTAQKGIEQVFTKFEIK